MSGTRIQSNKAIAAYSGNIYSNIRGKSGDHLVDQLVPLQYLGKSFIVIKYTEVETLVKILGECYYD